MDKQIEMLKTKLNDKVAEIDRRLKRCEKDVLIDHSEHRERLHSQARGYERVIKMIEELPDPIPLPTIKPGDEVRIIDAMDTSYIGKKDFVTKISGTSPYSARLQCSHGDWPLSSLEVIPNGE